MDNANNFSEPNLQSANNISEEGLTKRERVVIWIFSLLNPVITGAVVYFMWRKSYPKKAKQGNKISWVCFFIDAVVFIVIQVGQFFFVKKFYGSVIPSPSPYSNENFQDQSSLKTTKDQTANWKMYSNETMGFAIKYPGDWTINTTRFGGSNISFDAPPSQESKNLETEMQRIQASGDTQAMLKFLEDNKDAFNKAMEQVFFRVSFVDNSEPNRVKATYESFNEDLKPGVQIQNVIIGGLEGRKYSFGSSDPAPRAIVIKGDTHYIIDGIGIADIFDDIVASFAFLNK